MRGYFVPRQDRRTIARIAGRAGAVLLLWLFAAGRGFAGGKPQENPARDETAPVIREQSAPEAPITEPEAAERPGPDRGEQVMRALAAAYPDRIGEAAFRDGDWAVEIRGTGPEGGTWYYYAGGRLLPEELREDADEYDPQPFYTYPAELPPWKDPDPEDIERFRDVTRRRQVNPPKRSQHFYDALWRAHTREEAYERVKTIRFLGRNVLVHYAILEELALVEEHILQAAKTDAGVKRWIDSLETLSGWNWRSIADTQSRSFHAYGSAIDLLPASRPGRETYWLWTAGRDPQWWAVPYEKRLHPPDAVIKAFEAYGFIWGGKWLFFDTRHFEYRPEIFILNKLNAP
jgi:hypothetical protein